MNDIDRAVELLQRLASKPPRTPTEPSPRGRLAQGGERPVMGTWQAYRHGYACGKNGADETNCNFRIFRSPMNTKAWERGKRFADKEKQVQP